MCVPLHSRNLQILATDIFKVINSVALPIFTEIFAKRNPKAALCTFQFHLLEVHIMELKAYRS